MTQTTTDMRQDATDRALRKFNRIKARDPGNPDHNDDYLQLLIVEEHQLAADQAWINAAGDLNRRCRGGPT